jgi:hypothetical protein
LLLCHTTLIWLDVTSSARMWVSFCPLIKVCDHIHQLYLLEFSVHAVRRLARKLMQLEQRLLRRPSRNFRVRGRRPCKGKRLKRRNL